MGFEARSIGWDRGQVGVLEDNDVLLVDVIDDKTGKNNGPILMNIDEYIHFKGAAGAQKAADLARAKGIDCRLFLKNHPGVK